MTPGDSSSRLRFKLTGHPGLKGIIVPYVRMTQRGKFVRFRQNKKGELRLTQQARYLDSMRWLRAQIDLQVDGDPIPQSQWFGVKVLIRMSRALSVSDVDNQAKAIIDALKGVAFYDDRYMLCLIARKTRDRSLEREEALVEIFPMKEGE